MTHQSKTNFTCASHKAKMRESQMTPRGPAWTSQDFRLDPNTISFSFFPFLALRFFLQILLPLRGHKLLRRTQKHRRNAGSSNSLSRAPFVMARMLLVPADRIWFAPCSSHMTLEAI